MWPRRLDCIPSTQDARNGERLRCTAKIGIVFFGGDACQVVNSVLLGDLQVKWDGGFFSFCFIAVVLVPGCTLVGIEAYPG